MTSDTCQVGQLSSPLQQHYNEISLSSHLCADIKYIYSFKYKMIPFIAFDAEIRNIQCHLNEAISNLHLIHVRI